MGLIPTEMSLRGVEAALGQIRAGAPIAPPPVATARGALGGVADRLRGAEARALGAVEAGLARVGQMGMEPAPAVGETGGHAVLRSLDEIAREIAAGRSRVMERDGEGYFRTVLDSDHTLQEMADLVVLEEAFVQALNQAFTDWFRKCREARRPDPGRSRVATLGVSRSMRGGRVGGPSMRPAPAMDPSRRLDVNDHSTWRRLEGIDDQVTGIVEDLRAELRRARTGVGLLVNDESGRRALFDLLELPTKKLVALQQALYDLVQMSPASVPVPRSVPIEGIRGMGV